MEVAKSTEPEIVPPEHESPDDDEHLASDE
jgi:hypothetical protein